MLAILEPRDNQCLFLMEMFVLSYANVLCLYPKLCLQVGSASWPRTYLTSMLYSDIVPLIYVNETICMVVCPSLRFKLIILWAQDKPFGVKIIPKCILWVRGLVPF